MKKSLTHVDIVKGRRYKVIGTPKHLKEMRLARDPWLGMTGEALWVDIGHNTVGMQFGGCKIRAIPPDCLEEAEEQTTIIDCATMPPADPNAGLRLMYAQLAKEKAAEDQKSMVTKDTVRLGQLYRITKVPPYWIRITNRQYPSMGAIGRLMKIDGSSGTLRLSDGIQRFVPFDCMELVTIRIPPISVNLNDEELIAKMIQKPLGTLKIIKGLAKMNKDHRLQAFLDRGVIF